MRVHFLTHYPTHATIKALCAACVSRGIVATAAPELIRADLLFPWAHDLPETTKEQRRARWQLIQARCRKENTKLMIPHILGKWEQYNLLRAAGIPTPDTHYAANSSEAVRIARGLGYPLVIKPEFKGCGNGVMVIDDETGLSNCWTGHHRLLQKYFDTGMVRHRATLVNNRILSEAQYVHRRDRLSNWNLCSNSSVALNFAERTLAISTCQALSLPYGGVDLLRTAVGSIVLEVNHAGLNFEKDLPSLDPLVDMIVSLAERKCWPEKVPTRLQSEMGHDLRQKTL